jgi:hypothetical protein
MKTAYVVTHGIQLPNERFQWRSAPEIISQPMLWEVTRGLPFGQIFRVRTEQNVGAMLNGKDRIESCVGLIDSTSRWRACLSLIRTALVALRLQDIAEPCSAVFGMMLNRHPASVSMQERQSLAEALRSAMDKLPPDDPRANFETSVAAMFVRLAFSENDIEVAHIVPYSLIWMVNGREHPEDREATIEVMASSVLLAESFNRLWEKAPEWAFYPLPAAPGTPAAEAAPQAPREAQEEAGDSDEPDAR